MGDIDNAVKAAIQAFKEQFGEGTKLDDGDQVVFLFNNCVMIMSLEEGTVKEEFIGGLPVKVDYTLKIYESEE